ncbi:MAG: class I SAM-dependent methyltransferase [Bacteroidales bacterium]|jgi:SAM-dependent methyltransferase
MKIRDSGMPEQKLWESFFDVDTILSGLEINSGINNLVEIGCGYGTFTIPASKRIKGILYAFDIDKEMIKFVKNRIQCESKGNIKLYHKDIIQKTTCLKSGSIDYVMLFNILHHENPEELFNEAYRILRPKGKVGIIHWRSDIKTPRGPDLSIRPKPDEIIVLLNKSKWKLIKKTFVLEPYHYGILIMKK